MAFADELADLKRDLKEAHIPVDDVLAIAGVNRSTWTRWGGTHTPRLDRWDDVKAAAASLLAERRGHDAAEPQGAPA
jgi:hypothetical protein